jgi:hypothetical protein
MQLDIHLGYAADFRSEIAFLTNNYACAHAHRVTRRRAIVPQTSGKAGFAARPHPTAVGLQRGEGQGHEDVMPSRQRVARSLSIDVTLHGIDVASRLLNARSQYPPATD